ncbi:SCL-interrupting locus protein homolog isoform X1 [Syngnathus typhle]|uniref:SCL-interrupting locus protein homolog isoform X1 n=1 Tax=Syngnathus typhle TaxID=161592 RepID=UPI002A69948D|nr:SCL-interrupting locus protein homolog isoform X1 [Syngnathus typhle]
MARQPSDKRRHCQIASARVCFLCGHFTKTKPEPRIRSSSTMSCPINPPASPAAAVFHKVFSSQNVRGRPVGRSLAALSFPKARTCLWDGGPAGEKLCIHLCSRRMPRLLLHEKALCLAKRHVRRCETADVHCFFLGSATVDADEGGVTVTLDRFDPGRERAGNLDCVPAAALPGDVLVPCLFTSQNSSNDLVQSKAELKRSISALQAHVSGSQPLELSQLLKVKGRVSCQPRGDAASYHLAWSSVCLSVRLDVHPLCPVPIIPTALLRSLSGAIGRRRGFVTMDESRKLLLLLESDPKASKLPLVGVWLSGVTQVSNPLVWAWCLRFLFDCTLQHRVVSEDNAFLLAIFASPRASPAFFQVRWPATTAASAPLDSQLLSASGCVTLEQQGPAVEGQTLEFELIAEGHVRQLQVFQDAQSSLSSDGHLRVAAPCISEQDSGVEADEWSPRPSPLPHLPAQRAPAVQPAVPELSVLMDDGVSADGHRAPPLLHSTPDPQAPHRLKFCAAPMPEPRDLWLSARAGGCFPSGLSAGSPPCVACPSHVVESCDAHQLLFQQDQQLRLLQAQVQMLLAAQEAQPTYKTETSCTTTTSVAVATGTSLLWGGGTPPRPLIPSSRKSEVTGQESPADVESDFCGERTHTGPSGCLQEATRKDLSQRKGRCGGGAQESMSMTSQGRRGDETQYRLEVDLLTTWCRDNNLLLNVDTTKEIVVDFRKGHTQHLPLTIDGAVVERVSSAKFLGVHISEDLSWSTNTASLAKKAQRRLYFLRKLRRASAPPAVMTAFYRGTIESVLSSCIAVWGGGCTDYNLKALQRIVNTAGKIAGASLPSLKDIYTSHLTRKATTIVSDVSHPAHSLFELLPSGKRYRSLRSRTSRLSNSFILQAVRILNSLPRSA